MENSEMNSVNKLDKDDDDVPALSADTMSALLEFYKEQEVREKLKEDVANGVIPETFEENWV